MSPHKPIRTCIGCGQKRFKSELLRIVRTPGRNIEIDLEANRAGRGAYLCFKAACQERAFKRKSLERVFGMSLPLDFMEKLGRVLNVKD